jgi:HD-GYP domain-containing protein (c-di-GMP phosphodiesterase class II)
LRADEIPLPARIVAVADVYDALTTKRVYKDAWTVDDAFEHLKAGSGTHFDPTCVGAILDARGDILEIQHSDMPIHQGLVTDEEA